MREGPLELGDEGVLLLPPLLVGFFDCLELALKVLLEDRLTSLDKALQLKLPCGGRAKDLRVLDNGGRSLLTVWHLASLGACCGRRVEFHLSPSAGG